MTDALTDRVFDSIPNETSSFLNNGFDGDSSLVVHSYQFWSVSPEDFRAKRTDLKARRDHLATFHNFLPTMEELKIRALRGEVEYGMLDHYAGPIGEKKKRINGDTRLIDFST